MQLSSPFCCRKQVINPPLEHVNNKIHFFSKQSRIGIMLTTIIKIQKDWPVWNQDSVRIKWKTFYRNKVADHLSIKFEWNRNYVVLKITCIVLISLVHPFVIYVTPNMKHVYIISCIGQHMLFYSQITIRTYWYHTVWYTFLFTKWKQHCALPAEWFNNHV